MTINPRQFLFALFLVVFIHGTGCAEPGGQVVAQKLEPGRLAGYLSPGALPDSIRLIPPPPSPGSAAIALDEETNRKYLVLRGTPRWKLAAEDAYLSFPELPVAFSCALDVPVTEKDTPCLYMLLRRTVADLRASTDAVKVRYNRTRPFVLNKQPICKPDDENYLLKSGSYPSGHTTVGWGVALVLAEIAPDRSDIILARGRAFGDSRLVCNVHWQSDVTEGRIVGSAVVARLHGEAAFRADANAAGKEIAEVRAKGAKPVRDCAAERKILGLE